MDDVTYDEELTGDIHTPCSDVIDTFIETVGPWLDIDVVIYMRTPILQYFISTSNYSLMGQV